MVTTLEPQLDSRKSFYNKARVEQDKQGNNLLYSYNTLVAEANPQTNTLKIYGFYSQTTLRHIKDFAYQIMGIKGTQKQLSKYLVE